MEVNFMRRKSHSSFSSFSDSRVKKEHAVDMSLTSQFQCSLITRRSCNREVSNTGLEATRKRGGGYLGKRDDLSGGAAATMRAVRGRELHRSGVFGFLALLLRGVALACEEQID
jgi:hypothetical protein